MAGDAKKKIKHSPTEYKAFCEWMSEEGVSIPQDFVNSQNTL